MKLCGRPSVCEAREAITELMKQNLDLRADGAAIEPSFQDWKYWTCHPLYSGSRGYVLHMDGRLVSHGCRWPIRLRTPTGDLDCFHMIDWVADPTAAGAGMKLLRDCAEGLSAVFSIGGSSASQKVVVAFGFKSANEAWVLRRPLRLNSAWNDSIRDWKLAARVVRNSFWTMVPRAKLRPGWQFKPVQVRDIPDALLPNGQSQEVISMRDVRLLTHIAACPRFKRVQAYLLSDCSGLVAYFLLAQVGHEVRLIDFGPAGLDALAAQMLGVSAQRAARADFPGAAAIATITTEPTVRGGLLQSGFRDYGRKTVRVLPLTPAIRSMATFRLTMIDWDAACL